MIVDYFMQKFQIIHELDEVRGMTSLRESNKFGQQEVNEDEEITSKKYQGIRIKRKKKL